MQCIHLYIFLIFLSHLYWIVESQKHVRVICNEILISRDFQPVLNNQLTMEWNVEMIASIFFLIIKVKNIHNTIRNYISTSTYLHLLIVPIRCSMLVANFAIVSLYFVRRKKLQQSLLLHISTSKNQIVLYDKY